MNPLNLIPAPYRLIALFSLVVLFTGSVYAMGYSKGNKRATDACEAAKVVELKKYQAEYQKAVDRANVLAQKNIKTVEIIRDRTRTIRIKEKNHATAKPLPDVCVLDDERVRILNDALANQDANTGKPDGELPSATTTD